MGLLSWWRGKPSQPPAPKAGDSSGASLDTPSPAAPAEPAPGMNGAVEVRRRPGSVTVFEFGTVAASGDRVTLAGYCPVSDELEPCRWEIVKAAGSDAPQFRIVF